MAGTHGGNFGSMTMFLTPVFSLIMHKILVNIHAFDILHVDLKMGLSSRNNIFCERNLHYLAYKYGHIRCPIYVNNNILPTVTVGLLSDNVLGVPNETVM